MKKFQKPQDLIALYQQYNEDIANKIWRSDIVSMGGFAKYCGISRQMMLNYSKKDEYKDVIADIKDDIASIYEEKALSGKINTTFAIFLLTSKFGYKNNHNVSMEGNLDLKVKIIPSSQKLANSEKEVKL